MGGSSPPMESGEILDQLALTCVRTRCSNLLIGATFASQVIPLARTMFQALAAMKTGELNFAFTKKAFSRNGVLTLTAHSDGYESS